MYNLETYINQIMEEADLACKDDLRVRCELNDHLQEIVETSMKNKVPVEEIIMTIEKEFGDPKELGREIARAKGKFRTYLKKEARKLPVILTIAIILAVGIKTIWIKPFKIVNDKLAPTLCRGDMMLVNKLSSNYQANDIVVYKENDHAVTGIVRERKADGIVISGKAEEDKIIAENMIIGRVFAQWR